MDVFRFFRPSGERKEDRPEKRRAQVRRAQQTYRLRKDRYARALENEVARLRSVELNLVRENQRLRETIGAQGSGPADYGAGEELAAGLVSGAEPYGEPEVGLSDHHHRSPGARHRALICSKASASRSTSREHDTLVFPDPTLPRRGRHVPAISASPVEHRDTQLGDLNLTTMGMEFVLALEEPCLGHVHGDPNSPDQASGHALTISSHLLSFSPPSLPRSPGSNEIALIEACGNAPAAILDRLLTLSTNFALDDELTPVQAWNRIQLQLQLGVLKMDRLQSLVKRLVATVKCHGFGAVLKGDAFQKLVNDTIVGASC